MNEVQKVLSELVRYKNGMVSESMTRMGIVYKRNYGVSVPDIKRIAAKYAPKHSLAMQLFDRPIRETRLAAVYIADPLLLTTEEIDNISRLFTNPEIVEHACMALLWKSTLALDFAYKFLDTDQEFLHKAAWMLLGKTPQSAWTNTLMCDLPVLLGKTNYLSKHVQSALLYALPNIVCKNNEARKPIYDWCDSLPTCKQSLMLVDEIRSGLTEF